MKVVEPPPAEDTAVDTSTSASGDQEQRTVTTCQSAGPEKL